MSARPFNPDLHPRGPGGLFSPKGTSPGPKPRPSPKHDGPPQHRRDHAVVPRSSIAIKKPTVPLPGE